MTSLALIYATQCKCDGVKFKLEMHAKMIKLVAGDISEVKLSYFCSDYISIFSQSQVNPSIWEAVNDNVEKLIRYCVNGSGWVFHSIELLVVKIIRFSPIKKYFGGSFLPLPDCLVRKNGLINIRNNDQLCMIWCVLLHMHIEITGETKGKHLRNPKTFHKYLKYLNLNNIEFPVEVSQVPSFEKNNSISINVFRFAEDRRIIPEYLTGEVMAMHINLLLISREEKQHYVYISNLSNLLGKIGLKAKFFCNRCMKPFELDKDRICHQSNCGTKFASKVVDGEALVLKKFSHLMKSPFVIYADFMRKKIDSDEPLPFGSSTTMYQIHEPYSYCILVLDHERKVIHKRLYRGLNCIADFIEHLYELHENLDLLRRIDMPMQYTESDRIDFEQSTHCWLCEKPFQKEQFMHVSNLTSPNVKDLHKCRHHCHLTSKYIGACHSLCNFQLKYKNREIPVLIHNFSRYDSHLILGGINRDINVKIIPSNSEHYISVSFDNKIKFLDIYQFLPSSLSALISEIPKENFCVVPQIFEDDFIDLVARKGIFPYDYVDCHDKFDDDKLLEKHLFFNSLNDEEIENEE